MKFFFICFFIFSSLFSMHMEDNEEALNKNILKEITFQQKTIFSPTDLLTVLAGGTVCYQVLKKKYKSSFQKSILGGFACASFSLIAQKRILHYQNYQSRNRMQGDLFNSKKDLLELIPGFQYTDFYPAEDKINNAQVAWRKQYYMENGEKIEEGYAGLLFFSDLGEKFYEESQKCLVFDKEFTLGDVFAFFRIMMQKCSKKESEFFTWLREIAFYETKFTGYFEYFNHTERLDLEKNPFRRNVFESLEKEEERESALKTIAVCFAYFPYLDGCEQFSALSQNTLKNRPLTLLERFLIELYENKNSEKIDADFKVFLKKKAEAIKKEINACREDLEAKDKQHKEIEKRIEELQEKARTKENKRRAKEDALKFHERDEAEKRKELLKYNETENCILSNLQETNKAMKRCQEIIDKEEYINKLQGAYSRKNILEDEFITKREDFKELKDEYQQCKSREIERCRHDHNEIDACFKVIKDHLEKNEMDYFIGAYNKEVSKEDLDVDNSKLHEFNESVSTLMRKWELKEGFDEQDKNFTTRARELFSNIAKNNYADLFFQTKKPHTQRKKFLDAIEGAGKYPGPCAEQEFYEAALLEKNKEVERIEAAAKKKKEEVLERIKSKEISPQDLKEAKNSLAALESKKIQQEKELEECAEKKKKNQAQWDDQERAKKEITNDLNTFGEEFKKLELEISEQEKNKKELEKIIREFKIKQEEKERRAEDHKNKIFAKEDKRTDYVDFAVRKITEIFGPLKCTYDIELLYKQKFPN